MNILRADIFLLQHRALRSQTPNRVAPTSVAHPVDFWTIACLLTTDEGLVGHGYGWANEARRGRLIANAIREVAGLAVGCDPQRVEMIWDEYWRVGSFVGHSGLSMIGASVIDMALWDIKCKATNTPLWLALGGHKERAPTYSSDLLPFYTVDELRSDAIIRAAESLVEAGHTALKFFPRHRHDIGVFREVVRHLGQPVRWALDAVGVWHAHEAIRAGQEVEDLDLLWIEDPVPSDDLAGLARVTRTLATPICTGENAYYVPEAHRLVQAGIRYLSLDLQRCGGITGWRKIAALAEAHQVEVTSHIYSSIGAHLVCGTRNAKYCEYLPDFDGIAGPALDLSEGYATPSQAPGIGVHFEKRILDAGLRETVVR